MNWIKRLFARRKPKTPEIPDFVPSLMVYLAKCRATGCTEPWARRKAKDTAFATVPQFVEVEKSLDTIIEACAEMVYAIPEDDFHAAVGKLL